VQRCQMDAGPCGCVGGKGASVGVRSRCSGSWLMRVEALGEGYAVDGVRKHAVERRKIMGYLDLVRVLLSFLHIQGHWSSLHQRPR
jgi:hypothetical protein